LRPWK